jgi:hypothetical protein
MKKKFKQQLTLREAPDNTEYNAGEKDLEWENVSKIIYNNSPAEIVKRE